MEPVYAQAMILIVFLCFLLGAALNVLSSIRTIKVIGQSLLFLAFSIIISCVINLMAGQLMTWKPAIGFNVTDFIVSILILTGTAIQRIENPKAVPDVALYIYLGLSLFLMFHAMLGAQ